MTNHTKKCVIINDFTACEEIALGIQMPILRDSGFKVMPVPTKLLSYPLCREDAVSLSTEEFARQMLNNWTSAGEAFDLVLTGFIPDVKLVEDVLEFCRIQKGKGTIIVIDPVMGDNGHPYKSVKPENIAAIRALLQTADYCLPNYTEACLLTGIEYSENGIDEDKVTKLLNSLAAMGVAVPVVTGVPVDDKKAVIMMKDGKTEIIPYNEIEGGFSGTGDRFAAFFAAGLLSGATAENAIKKAETEVTDFLVDRIATVN